MFSRRLLCCLALIVALPVWADSSQTNVLPAVVVTGTRIPVEVADSPSSISVITGDQIVVQQQQTVADVLRDVAGLNVVSTGQPGSETSVFMRGANSSQTLVLIDGVRVNNPFNNAFDFANLSVDNIERIEVLRGPQSTLYGSEALGGVINIVTKQGASQPTGSIFTEGGTDDSFRTRAAYAAAYGKFSFSAAGSYFTTANERLNSDTNVGDFSGHAAYQALENLSIGLLANYTHSFAGEPGDRFSNDPNNSLHDENTLVALTVNSQPADWWNTRLILSYNHDREFDNEPEPNPSPDGDFGAYAELTKCDRADIDFQNIFQIIEPLKLLLGGTFDHSVANDTNTYGAVDRFIDDKALYTELDYSPFSRLTASAGGRVDDYTSFGTHGTYRVGIRDTTPVTETILRASVGTGFRAPSVIQLSPGAAYGGNPDLQPEESLGWDIGAEQPLLNSSLHLGATYFQNDFKNLIISTNVPAPIYSQLVNTGRARTDGLENFIAWTPLTNLNLRGTYTWMIEARDLTHDAPLIRRPQHSGSLAADYRFLKKFTANLTATFVGKQPDTNFYTGEPVTDSGYVKVDLGLHYDVCKNFAIYGRIENLFDDRYEEVFGYPALGRMFWGGGIVHF